MNHIYRTVWNEISRTVVAVAENVRVLVALPLGPV